MYNPFNLKGKRILITGASSGIGEACAEILSKLGANLILNGRNVDRLNKVRTSLKRPESHLIAPFDLQETEQITSWIKGFLEEKKITLDGFVHSAGIDKLFPVRTVNITQINSLMNINFNSGIMLLKACISRRISNDESSFVFISAVAGSISSPGNSIYAASKAALNSFVKSSAREFSPRIRINGIAPGIVQTPLINDMPEQYYANLLESHPLGIGQPEDIAFAAAYLLSGASKWVTGTILTVDGGCSL